MGFPDAATIVEDSMRGYDPETDDVLIDCVAMDDGTAVVTFNAEQLVKKKQWLMERIAVELKYHTEVNPSGKIELSSDFRMLDIYVNEYEALEALPGWGGVLNGARAVSAYCGQLQILDHPGDSSWDITWNIYNPESGKLVVGGDPRTGAITYDEQTWAASR